MSSSVSVLQVPSLYYGHIYEHIEYGGIYQIVFKGQPQPVAELPAWEVA